MNKTTLQIVLFAAAFVLLLGLVSVVFLYRLTVGSINNSLAERNKVGFVVNAGGVVFRTPNSELLAPAWNEPVIQADPGTFRTIFHSSAFCLGADAKTVFLGEGKRVYRLNNSQASTFRLLTPDGRFTCDAQHVYFMGFELPQAEPASFQVLGQFISKDAKQVFAGPIAIPNADPATFQIENEGKLLDLESAYSEGPCTIKKLSHNQSLEIREFRARDKNGYCRLKAGR